MDTLINKIKLICRKHEVCYKCPLYETNVDKSGYCLPKRNTDLSPELWNFEKIENIVAKFLRDNKRCHTTSRKNLAKRNET